MIRKRNGAFALSAKPRFSLHHRPAKTQISVPVSSFHVGCSDAAHHDIAHQFGHRRRTGAVRSDLTKALYKRTRSIRMREELDQLHADVSNINIRPDDNIGLSCHFGFPFHLLRRNCRRNGCIILTLCASGKATVWGFALACSKIRSIRSIFILLVIDLYQRSGAYHDLPVCPLLFNLFRAFFFDEVSDGIKSRPGIPITVFISICFKPPLQSYLRSS